MPENPSETQLAQIAETVAKIREQWGVVTQTVVAACNGNADAAAQLNRFLDDMAQKEDWRNLIGVWRRVLAGERDPEALLADLDDTDMLIVSDTLRGLGVDPRSLPTLPGEEPADNDDGKMVSLEEFLGMVTAACKADTPAGRVEQLQNATQGIAVQANNPPEIRALGRVLNAILSGDRNPDLSGLPGQLVGRVQQMLGELK